MYALNQCPIYGSISPRSGFTGAGIKGWKLERQHSPLPLAKFLLPVPVTLHSADLEALVREGGMPPLGGTTMIPLK